MINVQLQIKNHVQCQRDYWQQSLGGPAATAGLYGREIITSSSTLCYRENSLVSCIYNVNGLLTLFYFFDHLHIPSPHLFDFKDRYCFEVENDNKKMKR